jgi:hypothetical protein
LRVIAGGLLAHPVGELGRAEIRDANDRWTNEGGRIGSAVAVLPPRAVAARR